MLKLIAAICVATVIAGCQKPEPPKESLATVSIEVKTAKCESCAQNITTAVQKVDGVMKASVDLERKIVVVEYVPSKVTLASLENTIANAGYDANNTKRNDVAYLSLDACCR